MNAQEMEPQEPQDSPTCTLRRLRGHGSEASTTWMVEAYIADDDGPIDTAPAEKYGLAVGDLRYKVCFAAKGFLQVPGGDSNMVFAPVAQGTIVRAFLAVAANHNYEIYHLPSGRRQDGLPTVGCGGNNSCGPTGGVREERK